MAADSVPHPALSGSMGRDDADKYCSLKETLLERKGRNKNRKKSENDDAEDTC